MNRIFRQPAPGVPGYAALALFVVAYLGAAALIIAPGALLPGAPAQYQTQP